MINSIALYWSHRWLYMFKSVIEMNHVGEECWWQWHEFGLWQASRAKVQVLNDVMMTSANLGKNSLSSNGQDFFWGLISEVLEDVRTNCIYEGHDHCWRLSGTDNRPQVVITVVLRFLDCSSQKSRNLFWHVPMVLKKGKRIKWLPS
jgi:hypothetical protein